MKEEMSEVLSAFVDGEDVDGQVLVEALNEPGACELLIEFVQLRNACRTEERPNAAFYAAIGKTLSPVRWRRAFRLLAAAAVLVLATLGGFELGSRLSSRRQVDEPPTPTRVLQFERGAEWHQAEAAR
jgi:hypothetical protein